MRLEVNINQWKVRARSTRNVIIEKRLTQRQSSQSGTATEQAAPGPGDHEKGCYTGVNYLTSYT